MPLRAARAFLATSAAPSRAEASVGAVRMVGAASATWATPDGVPRRVGSSAARFSATAAAPQAVPSSPGSADRLSAPDAGADAADGPTPSSGVYPGDRILPFTSSLDPHPPSAVTPIPVFRLMDEEGRIRPDARQDPIVLELAEDRERLVRAYAWMVRVSVLDTVLYDSQRQGRISFYMTSSGEEATHIGTSMALQHDDELFAQYREVGTLLWRGFSLQQVCDQCFGNADDLGKGRQMPIHYGSRAHHFQTISSPLCTQLPQAVGAAYFNKVQGNGRVSCCFFGEGAASEGDFHAALNMAATQEAPVIFFCRNNGYAISTPVSDQYRGDGIAARGVAYGIHTIRVDGNDLFAVYAATKRAREIASGGGGAGTRPVLIEAMTYREGHHSTSDDSTRYRSADEIKVWRARSNPLKRLRAFLERKGWWSAEREAALVAEERKGVLAALATAEQKPKPDVSQLFTDVYKEMPASLEEQARGLDEHLLEHPGKYGGAH